MAYVQWQHRNWRVRPLPAYAAGHVARLGSSKPSVQFDACLKLLHTSGIDLESLATLLWQADSDPDLMDLVSQVLEVGTVRPWRTVVALCSTLTGQWTTIQGRMINAGVPRPLEQIGSLTALLDAVETMILDSQQDEKGRDTVLRQLYRGDVNEADTAPPGWEETVDLESVS